MFKTNKIKNTSLIRQGNNGDFISHICEMLLTDYQDIVATNLVTISLKYYNKLQKLFLSPRQFILEIFWIIMNKNVHMQI